jgi:hypothetical protein
MPLYSFPRRRERGLRIRKGKTLKATERPRKGDEVKKGCEELGWDNEGGRVQSVVFVCLFVCLCMVCWLLHERASRARKGRERRGEKRRESSSQSALLLCD